MPHVQFRTTTHHCPSLWLKVTEKVITSTAHLHNPTNMVAERRSMARKGDLGVEVENLKGDVAETKRSLAADETLAAKLAESWDSQSSEWGERRKSRAEEILAIHETINLTNNDDALTGPSLVQVLESTAAVARRAMDELRQSPRTPCNSASNLKLISLALNGRSVDLS